MEMAEDNCMREDLYFRLAVFPIHIPPLRSRPADVPLLANHFLFELNQEHETDFQLTEEAIARLIEYPWPGNVRELRHTIHRAFIMSDPNQALLTLPRTLSSPFSRRRINSGLGGVQVTAGQSIEAVEKELILLTLDALNGDKHEAAKVLGVSVKTLYNRLKEYEDSEPKAELRIANALA
jgi:DNA-binding NtrC family response regulator